MAELLYINSNPKPEGQSFGLQVGRTFLEEYKNSHPNDKVTELDLYQMGIPHLDADVFNGWGKLQQGSAFDQLTNEEKSKVGRINELTDQFVAADKYVFVTPLWNLSLPPITKAYIDAICIAGKTFDYTEQGPQGLLKDKKAFHIHACGGVYSEGPAKDFEFGSKYVVGILNFLGVTAVETLFVEGMAQTPDQAENIKNQAAGKAKVVAKNF